MTHIAVLDPAVQRAETTCFNSLLFDSPMPLTYHLPKISGMDSLSAVSEPSGILVLGSLSSVNDNEPWQKSMNDWLLPRMLKGVPTLGLCYGHQLIAHLFGGKIAYHSEDKLKFSGFRTVQLKANRLWTTAMVGDLAVSHCEHVTHVPTDFEVVGTSSEVEVDAIAHKTLPIWGFQPHPEATLSFLRNRGISESLAPKLAFGRSLMKHFLEFVKQGGP